MRYIKTKLDINKQNYIKLDCMQNDDISLEVTLLENGVAYPVKNNVITLNWLKADNTFIVISGSRITISNNVVTINLLKDCTRVVGESRFELVIKDSASKQVSTFPFSIDVVGSVLGTSESSKNVVTVIEELDKTLDEAQVVIDKINAKGNGVFTIPSSAWVGTIPNLTYRITHNMISKNLIISTVDTDTQESMPNDFKYIDMNTIELRSTTKTNITVAINANYYSGKDANTVAQEVVDARKGEVSLKSKMDKIDNGKLDKTAKAESAKVADSVAWNNVTSKPTTYPASMIVEDSNRRFITDAERTKWNMPSTTSQMRFPNGHVFQCGTIQNINYIGKTIELPVKLTTPLTVQATTGKGSYAAAAEFLTGGYQIRVFNPISDTLIDHVYWFVWGIE
jgi:hypothetical protein